MHEFNDLKMNVSCKNSGPRKCIDDEEYGNSADGQGENVEVQKLYVVAKLERSSGMTCTTSTNPDYSD